MIGALLSNDATVHDGDLRLGSAALRAQSLNRLNDLLAGLVKNTTEDDVLAIEPVSDDGSDEELRAVGVGTCVSHGEEEGLIVVEVEVLVIELLTVDGNTTGTIVVGEVTTLEHEVRDDAVEAGALEPSLRNSLTTRSDGVSKLVALAEGLEVFSGLRNNTVEETQVDGTLLATVRDLQEHLGADGDVLTEERGNVGSSGGLADDNGTADSTASRANLLKSADELLGAVVCDLTENDVLAIEPVGGNSGDEELRTVGVGTSVCHGQEVGAIVLLREGLILESSTVDGTSTPAITAGNITTLEHEAGDNAVEAATSVRGLDLLARAVSDGGAVAELDEVLHGLGCELTEEVELDGTNGATIVRDVKLRLVGDGVRKGLRHCPD